jgi:hypothetical protein
METGDTLGLGPLKEDQQLVVKRVMMEAGDGAKPSLKQVRFRGCVGHGGEGVDTVGDRVDESL